MQTHLQSSCGWLHDGWTLLGLEGDRTAALAAYGKQLGTEMKVLRRRRNSLELKVEVANNNAPTAA